MENKKILYWIIGVIILLLVGMFLRNSLLTGKTIATTELDPALEKYRSEEIPEDCRLPIYEKDVNRWADHLSHHQETHYCLDYYD